MQWLGMDIGGANLKLADGNQFAESYAFALWKHPNELAQELRTLIAQAPSCDHLAVTMTGELADCFETKEQGVGFILDAVEQAADGRHTRVYLSRGALVTPQVARMRSAEVAAANWHALARFAGRFARRGPSLVIDIGSTTTDIIPMLDGNPVSTGATDTERLQSGELIYAGVQRTPVCALAETVPYRGRPCPIAREIFATAHDVYLLLGDLPEDPANHNTADGRPLTRGASRKRLGRMICADSVQFNHRDAVTIAQSVADAQTEQLGLGIRQAAARLPAPPLIVIASGHGEFLVKRAMDGLRMTADIVLLGAVLGPRISRCAPAHALAVLAREAMEP